MANQRTKKTKQGQEVVNSKEAGYPQTSVSLELRLTVMVVATLLSALLVRWGCARWLKAEGFVAGVIAWVLFVLGTGGLGNVTYGLRKMVSKLKSRTLQTKGADISTRLFLCSIAVVLALLFPAYWLSDIFEIGWSCWWEGFFNTIFASQAFVAGILVYYNAWVGVELLWVMFVKLIKKA